MDINQLALLVNELAARVARMEGSLSLLTSLILVLLPTVVGTAVFHIWRTAKLEGRIEELLRRHEAEAHSNPEGRK